MKAHIQFLFHLLTKSQCIRMKSIYATEYKFTDVGTVLHGKNIREKSCDYEPYHIRQKSLYYLHYIM